MSDRRLRELERRFAQEGTLEAERALLRVRVQVGDLTPDWLRLVASLGHAPARKVLGGFVRVLTLDDLADTLETWPPEALLRASLNLFELDPRRIGASRTPYAAALSGLQQIVGGVLAGEHHADAALALEERLRERWPGLFSDSWQSVVPEPVETAGLLLRCCQGMVPGRLRGVLHAHRRGSKAREAARTLREVLVPWALAGRGCPPAGLVPDVAVPLELLHAREDEDRCEFERLLESKPVKRRATALRRRRRERALSLDRLRLAAWLGDPAAWLVAKPDGEPELSAAVGPDPSRHGAQLALQLSTQLLRFAKKLPRSEARRLTYLRRLHDPSATPSDLAPAWPDWSRTLVAHLALVLGDELVARFAAHDSDDARPAAALDAARAFHRDPLGDPQPTLEAARAASHCARRKLPPAVKAAAQGASWAARIVARTYTKARVPVLSYANLDVLDRVLRAGFEPQELWDLLRTSAIAWALGEDEQSVDEVRPYSPREAYRVGDQIEHPSFGSGLVTVSAGKRLVVDFAEGTRSLVQRA